MSFFRFWATENRTKQNKSDYKVLSDEQLLDLWIENRDNEAYTEICIRYNKVIYNIAKNQLKQRRVDFDIARDALQHCFLMLAQKPIKFKNKVSLRAYMIRIVHNFLVDHLTGFSNMMSLEQEIEQGFEVINDDDIENLAIWQQHKELLDASMKELDPLVSEVLQAYFKLECRRSELSVIFNLTEKQIDNIIYRNQEDLKLKILQKLKERPKHKME